MLLAPAHPTHSHPRWENLPQRLMLSLGESAALSSALFCLSKQHHGWGAGAPSLHFHHSYHHGKKQIGFCPCALARAALGSDGTSGFLPLSRVLLTTPSPAGTIHPQRPHPHSTSSQGWRPYLRVQACWLGPSHFGAEPCVAVWGSMAVLCLSSPSRNLSQHVQKGLDLLKDWAGSTPFSASLPSVIR